MKLRRTKKTVPFFGPPCTRTPLHCSARASIKLVLLRWTAHVARQADQGFWQLTGVPEPRCMLINELPVLETH